MPPRKRKHVPVIEDPELSGSSGDEASSREGLSAGPATAGRLQAARQLQQLLRNQNESAPTPPTAQGGRPAKAARGSGGAAGAGRIVSTYFQAQKDVGSSRTLADLNIDAAEGEEESLREYLASLPERNAAAKEAARRRHKAQVCCAGGAAGPAGRRRVHCCFHLIQVSVCCYATYECCCWAACCPAVTFPL